MKEIIEEFSTIISGQNGTYEVRYEKGEYVGICKYVTYPKTRYQTEPIYLLVECDMGDIIEYINKKSPLTSDDITEINMGIRYHSLYKLTDHLNR